MTTLRLVGMALCLSLFLGGAAYAQQTASVDPSLLTNVMPSGNAPDSVASLIKICAPVIELQYRVGMLRRGDCVNPTGAYLETMKAKTPPAEMGTVVADTVADLVKLYRPVTDCRKHETELPDAIRLAISYTTDQQQIDALKLLADAITQCQNIATGSIVPTSQLSPA